MTLPAYDDAVFISYTHVDDEPFGPEHLRWITLLHDQLANRLGQLMGERVSVWRDDKLTGNDVFSEALLERLSNVAVLVSVCSPPYLQSTWCRRELDQFVRSATSGQGLEVGTRSRVFKVLKTPVARERLPQPLLPLLGYEFYEMVSGRIREFLLNPVPEERWKFYARVDDLAQDIAGLLRDLASSRVPGLVPAEGQTVFLSEVTPDVGPCRDDVRRELERRGHTVLPQRPLPPTMELLTTAVNDDLSRAQLSVHLLGNAYGPSLEGERRSAPHVQLDLASAAASNSDLIQLIWVPAELDPADAEQTALVTGLHAANVGDGVEVVRAPLESFKAYVLDRITSVTAPLVVPPRDEARRIYLVYDKGDQEEALALRRLLEASGHVVIVPLNEGTAAEAREVHETSMVLTDAVLIYYGNATEHWLRMKMFDFLKAAGWGRTEPFLAKAVVVAEPLTPHKTSYATNEALVLRASSTIDASVIEPFLLRLAQPSGV